MLALLLLLLMLLLLLLETLLLLPILLLLLFRMLFLLREGECGVWGESAPRESGRGGAESTESSSFIFFGILGEVGRSKAEGLLTLSRSGATV
jgi:hypothetical protein